MNNRLKSAGSLPVKAETPGISLSPITLDAPDRGMGLDVRVSAPLSGSNLPVILLSHGHGPSPYIPSADGYGPIVNFWASQGFVVIQPTHLNAKARGMDPDMGETEFRMTAAWLHSFLTPKTMRGLRPTQRLRPKPLPSGMWFRSRKTTSKGDDVCGFL